MKITEREFVIDIHPFLDQEDDDTMKARITVFKDDPDPGGKILVSIASGMLDREQIQLYADGLLKAIELSQVAEDSKRAGG